MNTFYVHFIAKPTCNTMVTMVTVFGTRPVIFPVIGPSVLKTLKHSQSECLSLNQNA